jgi:hypothetical protein
MRKIGTILAVTILVGTLLVGAVVGREDTAVLDPSGVKGVQMSYAGSVTKILSYRWELAQFYIDVENFGGYEIKVNVDKKLSGDTGYFLTWLDKKGFSVGPWENGKFTLYVLARFNPEPNRVEEIDITLTITSGIYSDSMTFHVELLDIDSYPDDDDNDNNPNSSNAPTIETHSAVCSSVRTETRTRNQRV